MKKIVLVVAGLLVVNQAMAKELVDRLVAVVNGSPILFSEVQDKIDAKMPVLFSSYPAGRDQPIFDQALQDAINYLLVEDEAERLEIEFSDAEVEAEIVRTQEQRGFSLGLLIEELRRRNVDYEDYKETFRKQMILGRFQGRVIAPNVKVTDKDLETFYLKKTGEQSNNLELTLRQILIKIPDDTSSEIAAGKKKLANKVYRDLEGGMEFSEAVKIYSDDASGRENGGMMGSFKLNDLAPMIRKAVEKLKVGEFSRPVKTPMGYYIFYLDKREFTGSSDFESQKGRLERELRIVESNNQAQKWLVEQRKRSDIKIIK